MENGYVADTIAANEEKARSQAFIALNAWEGYLGPDGLTKIDVVAHVASIKRDIVKVAAYARDERREQQLAAILAARNCMKSLLGLKLEDSILMPKVVCGTCFEQALVMTHCDVCRSACCQDCIRHKFHPGESSWSMASAIDLSNAWFRCNLRPCPGRYPLHAARLLCDKTLKHFTEVAASEPALQMTIASGVAKGRHLAAYRALRTSQHFSDDKLLEQELEALEDAVSVACPSCRAPFADYDACVALQCSACATRFCALCLDGGFDSSEGSHDHARVCTKRPACMQDPFFFDNKTLTSQSMDIRHRAAPRGHRTCLPVPC